MLQKEKEKGKKNMNKAPVCRLHIEVQQTLF
jgi:hypothetical protein